MDFRRVFRTPGSILALAVLTGAAAVAVYAVNCVDLYRDVAYCYAYLTREFTVHGIAAVSPLLPPLNIALAGMLCRSGVEAFTATVLVSGFFYVLTIWPLYFLLRRFMSETPAAWGTVVYIITPKMMRFSCSGLPDSARIFFAVAAVTVLLAVSDKPDWKRLSLFGLALGGLTLSRGEGLAEAVILLATAAVLLWRRTGYSRSWRQWLAPAGKMLLVLLVFLTALSPRLYQSWRITGYPLPDYRLGGYFGLPFKPFAGIPREDGLRNTGLVNEADQRELQRQLDKATPGWRVGKILGDFVRGAYEPLLLLAALGLVMAIRARRYRYEYTVMLVFIAAHFPIYYQAGSAYRYYLFAVPLLLCLAMPALVRLIEWAGRFRFGRPATAAVLGLIVAAQLANGLETGLSRRERYKKEAGEWLRDHRDALGAPSGKRLCILFNRLVEVNFWSGGIPRFEYSWTRGEFDWCTGFDAAVFETGNEAKIIDRFRHRTDLVELKTPFADQITVFIPVKP